MATSNSIDFNMDLQECIRMAFTLITVLCEGDLLQDHDYNIGKQLLNMMLKNWQTMENNLWVKQTATLFLQNSQNSYTISTTTTDNFTTDKVITTAVTTDAIAGQNVIFIDSTDEITDGDYIGIIMDDDYIHWSTVTSHSSTSVLIASGITYVASAGNLVFSYTNKLPLPFNVTNASRTDNVSGIDTQMNFMSYREYFNLPNKTVKGVPTVWTYNRQLTDTIINVWLTPVDVSYRINLIISRRFQDMDVNSDNFDFPQEWLLPITYRLAVLLAPIYGKASDTNFTALVQMATKFEQDAKAFDNEPGSLFFMPSTDGYRQEK